MCRAEEGLESRAEEEFSLFARGSGRRPREYDEQPECFLPLLRPVGPPPLGQRRSSPSLQEGVAEGRGSMTNNQAVFSHSSGPLCHLLSGRGGSSPSLQEGVAEGRGSMTTVMLRSQSPAVFSHSPAALRHPLSGRGGVGSHYWSRAEEEFSLFARGSGSCLALSCDFQLFFL